jgi:hypothetical protein
MASKKKKQPDPQDMDAFLAEMDEAKFKENQEILRNLRTARAIARTQEEVLADVKERLALYEGLESQRLEPPVWTVPKKKGGKHAATLVLGIGDQHWGEVVNPDRIEGVNAYNVEIAGMRMKRAFERTVVLARDYMTGLEFDGVQVLSTGDCISGLIHEELKESNEQSVTESVLGVSEALSAGIALLAEEFGKVNVAGVVGNHSRLSRNNPTKNPQECLDWLVLQMVARDFDSDDRVTISAPPALGMRVQVYDTVYYLTHGTQFRGGSGIAGALSPLMLGVHRAGARARASGRPFTSMVIGHFHQAIWYPSRGLIVCGTLKGFDEYAASREFTPEPPQANLWVVTPERGATSYAPVFAADREAEGW